MMTIHLAVGLVDGRAGDAVKYIYILPTADEAKTFTRMAHPNVTKSDVIEWEILPALLSASAADAFKLHQEEIKDEETNDDE